MEVATGVVTAVSFVSSFGASGAATGPAKAAAGKGVDKLGTKAVQEAGKAAVK